MNLSQPARICSALEIENFDEVRYNLPNNAVRGGSRDAYTYEYTGIYHMYGGFEECKKYLKDLCRDWDKRIRDAGKSFAYWDSRYIQKLGCVIAWTNSKQVTAEKFLKELGFTQNGPFKKIKHGNADLSLWVMDIQDFMKAIGYKGVDPKTCEPIPDDEDIVEVLEDDPEDEYDDDYYDDEEEAA